MNQFGLLKERRFWPLFWTQLFGALNDNLFKNALVILVAYGAAEAAGYNAKVLVPICQGLFIFPFFLFSATAGQIADKLEKSRLVRGVKILEIVVMLLAALGFSLMSIELLIVVLFLMGLQSSLFGPVKFGVLPQILDESELVGGNALIESGTFLAILVGTILGGVLISLGTVGVHIISVSVVALAVIGWLFSVKMQRVEPSDPTLKINWNPVSETYRVFKHVRRDETVFLSIMGVSWFWFFGATFLTLFPDYTKGTLQSGETVVTLFLTLFSIGIGIGSMFSEKLARARIELGLVPLGSIGMSLFCIDLFFASHAFDAAGLQAAAAGALAGADFEALKVAGKLAANGLPFLDYKAFISTAAGWRILIDMLMIAIFGGFYIVPLFALVQEKSEPAYRSRIIAGNNILNALFMVISAVMVMVFGKLDIEPTWTYLVLAAMNAAVAIYIYGKLPDFLLRFIVWTLVHSIYRLKTEGLDRVPEEGPVVLVANHVTFVDGLILTAALKRPVRFVMYHKYAKMPLIRYVVKHADAVPIAGKREDPQLLQQAMDKIASQLEAGEVVCIFPEGKLTTDGEMIDFREGVERIIKRTPAPVLPLAFRGLWGSVFSLDRRGKLFGVMPKRFWSRIELVAGELMQPQEATAEVLQQRVKALRGDAV